MEFSGAGTSTEIIPEYEVSQLFNFSPNSKRAVSAHGFKKIIYKNLYQGIDMEILFPEDKTGFKYNFIIHPGADAHQIQIRYPLNEGLNLNSEGNIEIGSLFGNFTDHAPIAVEAQTTKPVDCSFILKNNSVRFSIGNYDKSKGLIIDPWTSTPVFSGGNNAYDVDWDNSGNCYAYGGVAPFQVIKFNSAGAVLWSYTTSFSSAWYYGDFAVDRNSGSVYMTDGFNSGGAQAIKINSAGSFITIFNGNSLFQEMWRISFSKCTNQAVIAGGGTSNPSYSGCYLDTNLAGMVPVNVINSPTGLHDMWGLTLDAFGGAYFVTAKTQVGSAGFDNIIYKVPTPALTPITWQASEGYNFVEVASVNYAPGPPNGYNGITMSNVNLYTYDGYILKKWNSATGAQVASVNINGASQSTMTYGGLDADDCDNLFLGLNNTILQYNSALAQVGSITKAGSVYDVSFGANNILYSCGAGFVSADQLNLLPCTILHPTHSITNPSCGTPTGSATVTVTGGTSPYAITWNTSPVQTGAVASNLNPGTYIATIKDNSCIKQTTYDTVIISSSGTLPLLAVTAATICNGASTPLTASGATTYTWSPATGLNTNSGANVIASPTITTIYTVTGSQSGCNGSVTSTVTVSSASGVTVNSPTVCAGTAATMTASGASTYTWSTGGTGNTLTASPASTTNYPISATDVNGCPTSGTSTITVNPLPLVTATSATICPTNTATLTASGANTYTWNTGAITASITAAPLANTNYTVTATDVNGCVNTATTSITISPPLVVTASSNSPICVGATLSLSTGVGVSWVWSGPNGFAANSQNPTIANVTTAATGTYSLTATDANGCFGSTTTNVTVNSLPVPTISSNTPLCANQTLNLTAGGGATYVWSGPNGFISVQQNPNLVSVTTAASGTYSVTVTDANNCQASTTTSVLVNPLPVVTVSGSTVCVSATINLTSSGGVSYSWSGPNLFASNTQNPSILNATVNMAGAYAVTVTDANGCVNGNVAQVIVNPLPVPTASSNVPCDGSTLNLTCNSGVSWSWSGPNAYSSLSQNPSITPVNMSMVGTYTVNMFDANGCAGSATTNVSVNPLPIPIASNNTPVCANDAINFTGSGGSTYFWNGPSSYTSSIQNPNIASASTNMNGTYTLTVTDANGCFASTTTQVQVNSLPNINVNSGAICIGNSITLTATGATTYSWSPATNLSSVIGASVIANPSSTAFYVVTGIDNNLCVNTATSTVTVNSLPIVTVNAATICIGSSGTLTASGANTYAWLPTTGLNSTTGTSVTVTVNVPTSYTVTGTDLNGCVNSDTTSVNVNPLPVLNVTPQTTTGCAPLCVNFANTTSAVGNCVWNFGDGTSSNNCTPNHCFSGQGTFGAALTLTDNNGCVNTATASVVVFPVPVADFNATPQPTTILDPTIHFINATTGAIITNYNWDFGDPGNTLSTQQNPVFIYQAVGSYSVLLVVTSDHGCKDSTVKIIKIDDEFMLYVPNAFTPNFDGTNDIFYAKGEGIKDFKMYIFDRWGEMVFRSDDIYKGWDGHFQGKGGPILEEDVYVWKIECKTTKGEPKLLKGTVSLIK